MSKKLSVLIDLLVPKDAKEIDQEVATEVRDRIIEAVESATDLEFGEVKDKLGECPKLCESDVPIEFLDGEGLQYIIKGAYKTAIISAVNANDALSLDRAIGLEFAKSNYLITAVEALSGENTKSDLL